MFYDFIFTFFSVGSQNLNGQVVDKVNLDFEHSISVFLLEFPIKMTKFIEQSNFYGYADEEEDPADYESK